VAAREQEEVSAAERISVVVPVYNEVRNVQPLHRQLSDVAAGLGRPWEVIYVDDGSTDGSLDRLAEIAAGDDRVTVIQLRRNFGQTSAVAAGIDHAAGGVIVLIDADLQNDPSDIPMLLDKLTEGYDVVSGWRVERKDPWLTRRLPSYIANRLISWTTGVHLHDYGCTLKAYRREALEGFRLYGEMHRLLPAYADQAGARIAEVAVRHHARQYGRSKYGLGRTFKVILDLLTVRFLGRYSGNPSYLFGGAGVALMIGSLSLFAFLFVDKIVRQRSLVESPLLLMSVMLFILGFQSVFMGLMAELLVRTYHESQDKPTYAVRRVINRHKGGSGP